MSHELQTTRPTFSVRVDLPYRLPSRYVASWAGLAAVLVFAAAMQPDTFGRFSLQLITALAGCLLIASLGQNLVVMLGCVDLSVPALMTLAAAMNAHFVGQLGSIESFLLTIVACSAVGAVSGALIAYLRLNALIVTFSVNAIVAAGLVIWVGQIFSTTGQSAGWLQSVASDTLLHVSLVL